MKKSFGILLYRIKSDTQFLLVHPGGPFYKNKHHGTWSIPKGEGDADESPLQTAIREFEEETGYLLEGDFMELNPITQKGGKQVFCWAIEGDFDTQTLISNKFDFEWPPNSGRLISIPEVDEARWFTIEDAKTHLNERQLPLLQQVLELIYSK